MTKEEKKQLKNLVIPPNATREIIIDLLSTIFDRTKISTATELLGNNNRCDFVTVRDTEVYIPFHYYYHDTSFEFGDDY